MKHYDPLHYVLMFIHGQPGWQYKTNTRTINRSRKKYDLNLNIDSEDDRKMPAVSTNDSIQGLGAVRGGSVRNVPIPITQQTLTFDEEDIIRIYRNDNDRNNDNENNNYK